MGVGAFLEPLVVVVLLFGGTWINREPDVLRTYFPSTASTASSSTAGGSYDDDEETRATPKQQHDQVEMSLRAHSPSLLAEQDDPWRRRDIGFGAWRTVVLTPNTAAFRNRGLSRLLRRFPFLVECWYWFLVYWVRLHY